MMQVILYLNKKCREVVAREIPISSVVKTGLFERVVKMKYDVPNDNLALFDDYYAEIDRQLLNLG
jgi:V/A-type H+-transporting ATPase subunit A